MGLTVAEKREKLSAALRIQEQIAKLHDTLTDTRETGGLKGTAMSYMPRGGQPLNPGDLIMEIEAEIDRLDADQKIEAEIVRRKIEEFGLSERDERLLTLRYVRCLRWKEVMALMGLKKSRIFDYEGEVLEKIAW